MRIDELLRPELILCRRTGAQSHPLLQELCEKVRSASGAITTQEILDTLGKQHPDPLPLGKGIVVYHLRTEKVSELTIGMATCPDGIADLSAPDTMPVRVVTLFLTPKKHAERYLSALAAIVEALSTPEVMERVVAAEGPQDVIAAFSPEEILALLADEGALEGKVTQMLFRMTPPELADLLEDASPKARGRCLVSLPPSRAAEVTRLMGLIPFSATLRRIPPDAAARILSFVPSSRCADVLQRLQPEEQALILKHLSKGGRKDIQLLLRYPPHTAGGIMTPEVLTVRDDTPVSEAMKRIAAFPDRRQTCVYVTSTEGKLLGWCQFHALAGAGPDRPVREFMKTDPPTTGPEKDQEGLFHILAKDEAQSVAVLGGDGTLVGVVTEDSLLSAMEQELNEDLQHMVGSKMVDPLHTPTGTRVKLRMPWLLLTLGGELMIALAITKLFGDISHRMPLLYAFLPAIMATGGNVGLQATTMVIRGLGMGKLKPKHTARIVLGEVKLGVLLGMICGAVAATTAYLIHWGEAEVLRVCCAVFLAMVSATLATSLVGTVEPIVLHRLKQDPATACGPFVTMFNDMFGTLVYLLIASLLFR